jgi:PAS domain-containing protein
MRQRSTTARPSGGRFAGFEGGGEAGALLRAFNWQDSSLGPMRDWSQSLVGIVSTMLHSQQPMFLWWGPELVQCYNDAYIPSFGQGKHPASFGQAGHLCWSEIWSIISPQIRAVMSSGESCWHEDQLVPILRNGRTEDVYWTYGYSPVFDDDGAVGGTLVICTETTARILAERRVAALQRVAEQIAGAVDFATAAKMAADSLGDACPDVPFVAVFERAASGPSRLVASSGCSETLVRAVAESLRADDLHTDVAPGVCREIALSGPDSPFGEPITRGAVVRTAANGEVLGALVVGVNPRLACDAAFRRFVEQIAEILALAKSKIDVHRASAAALAERNNLLLQAPIAAAVLGGPLHRFELANPHYCEMVQRSGLEGKTYLEAFPELRGTAIVSILDDVYRSGQRFVAEEHLLELDRGQCGKL